MLEKTIRDTMTDNGFDVDIEEFSVDFDYEISPEDLMKKVDSCSKDVCEADYDCIVAEGLSAWFWMLARYEMPVVCINPALYPDEVYADHISNEVRKLFWYVQDSRNQRTTYVACVTNNDELNDPSEDFGAERVFQTDVSVGNEEFWNSESELMKAIQLVLE